VIRAERRAYVPIGLTIAASVVAASVALTIIAITVTLAGFSPFSVAGLTLSAAFGSFTAFGETIERATPLMLTGLATVLALRGGFINLGAEGQMIAGAFAALSISAGVLPSPPLAVVPFAIVAGLVAGALSAVVIAILKLRLRIDEALVTVLLNVLAVFALQLSAGSPLASLPPLNSMQSLPLANAAAFPGWGYGLRAYAEPFLAILACLLAFALMRFTIWGLDIRATGGNVAAARFAGIRVESVTLGVAFLAGGLAGLAGAGEVIRAAGGSTPQLVLGFGYAGIAIAYLAALEPIGVLPVAFFVSIILGGIEASKQSLGIPLALGGEVSALLLLAGLIAQFATRYRLRLITSNEATG
jgi:general nucleoside transport system permease protein